MRHIHYHADLCPYLPNGYCHVNLPEVNARSEMFMVMNFMTLQDLVQGFDQETAAVVIARLTSHKMEMEVLLCLYEL